MKYWLTFGLLIVMLFPTRAQEEKEVVNIQQLVENIFTTQGENLDYEALYESLLLRYTTPLNLNKATAEEIHSLFILSSTQVMALINHREKHGALLSIYELQAIPGFDQATLQQLTPFVTIRDDGLHADNRPLITRIFSEDNNYLFIRHERTLEEKEGYASKYQGSADKLYSRFRISHPHDFSLGITAEKDAGEKGVDYCSFHFQVQNKGIIKNMLIGDYQLQLGQGLLTSGGFSIGKGAETITTIRRAQLGIRPYSSATENSFFRGAATTIGVGKRFDLTGIYSRTQIDGIIKTNSTLNTLYFSSQQTSGYHRTDNERAGRKTITERTIGSTLLYHDKSYNFQVGLTFLHTHYSLPLIKADRPYNRFEFSGTYNYNIGVSYSYNWQNFSFFGELARSKSSGIGMINGVIISLTPQLETSVLLRHYDRDFHTFYGSAFGENTRNINETGWYWGMKYSPSKKYWFSAYFDKFRFPWLKSGVNAPSAGYDGMLRASYRPSKPVLLYTQYRQKSKAQNRIATADNSIFFPVPTLSRKYLIHMEYPATEKLSFKSRVQFSHYNFERQRTSGYALMQDIMLKHKKISFSTRFALFDTDDFDNAQYAYERDVLYAFSIPAYYGRGVRQYLLFQYKFTRKIYLWVRYARTHYYDRDEISSGTEAIAGSTKTDIKTQLRITF